MKTKMTNYVKITFYIIGEQTPVIQKANLPYISNEERLSSGENIVKEIGRDGLFVKISNSSSRWIPPGGIKGAKIESF